MKFLALALVAISLSQPTIASAQRDDVPVDVIVKGERLFQAQEALCAAALPYERLEMRIKYIGWASSPNYHWSLVSDGKLSFTDFSTRGGGDTAQPSPTEVEVACFIQAEIQGLAKALLEPSPPEQDCSVYMSHATFGEVKLVKQDETIKREFSLGCIDIANPGFNAAIKAINHRVEMLVNYEKAQAGEVDD